jgi:hypothetical protein
VPNHIGTRCLGSNLYRLGVPDMVIQRILRHANVSTMATYFIETAANDVKVENHSRKPRPPFGVPTGHNSKSKPWIERSNDPIGTICGSSGWDCKNLAEGGFNSSLHCHYRYALERRMCLVLVSTPVGLHGSSTRSCHGTSTEELMRARVCLTSSSSSDDLYL